MLSIQKGLYIHTYFGGQPVYDVLGIERRIKVFSFLLGCMSETFSFFYMQKTDLNNVENKIINF